MLVCVRWCAAYRLSLSDLEEMMAERGVLVARATVHRWALKMLPVLAKILRGRKHPVGASWRVDETYVRVSGQWKYLYQAVDRLGQTVDFLLTARRDLAAARRFFEPAIDVHGARDNRHRQERRQYGCRVQPGRRQRPGYRAAAVEVTEQPRGAGSSCRQTTRPAHDGIQVFRVDAPAHRRHRSHAHDQEGAATLLQGLVVSDADRLHSLASR